MDKEFYKALAGDLGIKLHDAMRVAARAQSEGDPTCHRPFRSQVSPLHIAPSRGNTGFCWSAGHLTRATEDYRSEASKNTASIPILNFPPPPRLKRTSLFPL